MHNGNLGEYMTTTSITNFRNKQATFIENKVKSFTYFNISILGDTFPIGHRYLGLTNSLLNIKHSSTKFNTINHPETVKV